MHSVDWIKYIYIIELCSLINKFYIELEMFAENYVCESLDIAKLNPAQQCRYISTTLYIITYSVDSNSQNYLKI